MSRFCGAGEVFLYLGDDAACDHLDGDEGHEEAAEAFEGDETALADDSFDLGSCKEDDDRGEPGEEDDEDDFPGDVNL